MDGVYLVVCIWYIYQDELREIVVPEGGEKAVFEDIVVVDDDTHIYASSERVSSVNGVNQRRMWTRTVDDVVDLARW